jgi:hypothetical protein
MGGRRLGWENGETAGLAFTCRSIQIGLPVYASMKSNDNAVFYLSGDKLNFSFDIN